MIRKGKEKLRIPTEAEEDVGTARLVARARKAIAAGKEKVIPMAEVDALIARMNRVRRKR